MLHGWTSVFEHQAGAFGAMALWVMFSVTGCAVPGGGTVSAEIERPHGFTNSILVIRESQDGDVEHSWLSESEFDWSAWVATMENSSASAELVSAQRNCEQEQIECFRRCWKRRLPYPHDRDKASRYKYCQEKCLEQYMGCLRATGQYPLEFSKVDEAVEWLKRHRKKLLVGAVIVAAGVVFVVVSAGAGVLVLAPIVVL